MSEVSKKLKENFPGEVDAREKRKLHARKTKTSVVWFGLGMFGIVGWSVAVPTLLSIFCGIWIDVNWPGPYSWTLMLLIVGMVFGCANAWFWVTRQQREIDKDRKNDED